MWAMLATAICSALAAGTAEIRLLIANRQLAGAERVAVAELSAHPGSVERILLLAEIRLDQRRYIESLQLVESAKRIGPRAADQSVLEGLDYIGLGDLARAEEPLRNAAKLAPGSSRTRYYLGRLLYTLNDFEGARRETEEALKLNPQSAQSWDNLGLALEGLRRFREAEDAYLQAIRIVAADRVLFEYPALDLGKMFASLDRPAEARAWIDMALTLNPKSGEAHFQKGKLIEADGNARAALDEFQQAVSANPSLRAAHYRAARLLLQLGETERAKAEFQRVKDLTSPLDLIDRDRRDR